MVGPGQQLPTQISRTTQFHLERPCRGAGPVGKGRTAAPAMAHAAGFLELLCTPVATQGRFHNDWR